jgi:hypothetical protein
MKHSHRNPQSLFEPWVAWLQLPEEIRQHALDVLAEICLEIVDPPEPESENHESSNH